VNENHHHNLDESEKYRAEIHLLNYHFGIKSKKHLKYLFSCDGPLFDYVNYNVGVILLENRVEYIYVV